MRRSRLLVLVLCLFAITLLAQQQTPAKLTNADVVKMTKAGLADSVIVNSVQASEPAFDISPDALIQLKKDGVSQSVMDAMVTATSHARGASEVAAASAPPSVSVHEGLWVKTNGRPLPAEKTQLAETKADASTLGGLASNSAISQALNAGVSEASYQTAIHSPGYAGSSAVSTAGGILSSAITNRKPTYTYVWALPQPAAATALAASPSFEVHYADVPGISPDEYEAVLLKLSPTVSNWRLVGATRTKQDTWQKSTPEWQMYSKFIEDRVPANVERLEPGHVRLSPASPLAPGQYAIAFRPLSRTKKFAPTEIAKSEGAGLLFNTVWTFAVK